MDFVFDGGPHVVGLHHRTQPARGGDRLQPGNAGAHHQHPGGGHSAGRGHQQGKELRKMIGGQQHRFVTGDAGLRREGVHTLRPADTGHQIEAEGADLLFRQRSDRIRIGSRLEEADQHRAAVKTTDFLRRRWLHLEYGVASESGGRVRNVGTYVDVRRVAEEGRAAGACLDRDLQAGLDQPAGGFRNERHAALTGKAFLRNANLHNARGIIRSVRVGVRRAASGPPAPGGRIRRRRSTPARR